MIKKNIDNFINNLIVEKGYSNNTAMSYKNDLHNFFNFIKKDNIDKIVFMDLKKYIWRSISFQLLSCFQEGFHPQH